ncbi:UNKNOWN [Stylonychia lemnae]|uniref:Uncharacterized protein n=1 Tax=Stylonychia lemnae TaxID=5949 RepID=A0A078AFD1_STYLE|nr:UNKNOWN [Stylonychia lemnae]|eukprot:CDW80954.1 UNKNOWN [Stylonychia lemnae]
MRSMKDICEFFEKMEYLFVLKDQDDTLIVNNGNERRAFSFATSMVLFQWFEVFCETQLQQAPTLWRFEQSDLALYQWKDFMHPHIFKKAQFQQLETLAKVVARIEKSEKEELKSEEPLDTRQNSISDEESVIAGNLNWAVIKSHFNYCTDEPCGSCIEVKCSIAYLLLCTACLLLQTIFFLLQISYLLSYLYTRYSISQVAFCTQAGYLQNKPKYLTGLKRSLAYDDAQLPLKGILDNESGDDEEDEQDNEVDDEDEIKIIRVQNHTKKKYLRSNPHEEESQNQLPRGDFLFPQRLTHLHLKRAAIITVSSYDCLDIVLYQMLCRLLVHKLKKQYSLLIMYDNFDAKWFENDWEPSTQQLSDIFGQQTIFNVLKLSLLVSKACFGIVYKKNRSTQPLIALNELGKLFALISGRDGIIQKNKEQLYQFCIAQWIDTIEGFKATSGIAVVNSVKQFLDALQTKHGELTRLSQDITNSDCDNFGQIMGAIEIKPNCKSYDHNYGLFLLVKMRTIGPLKQNTKQLFINSLLQQLLFFYIVLSSQLKHLLMQAFHPQLKKKVLTTNSIMPCRVQLGWKICGSIKRVKFTDVKINDVAKEKTHLVQKLCLILHQRQSKSHQNQK